MRHAHRLDRAIVFKSRTQLRQRTHHDHQQCRSQENTNRQFGFRRNSDIGFLFLHINVFFHIVRVFQQSLIMRIVFQFFAQFIYEHASQTNTQNRGRNGNFQHIRHRDVLRLKHGDAGNNGGGNRAGDNRKLGSDNRHRQRTGRTDDFGNHGQDRVSHMARTCQDGKGVSYRRRDKGDVFRIAVQHTRGNLNHIVQTAAGLHGRCGRHYRHNHQHHINRRAGRLKMETKR